MSGNHFKTVLILELYTRPTPLPQKTPYVMYNPTRLSILEAPANPMNSSIAAIIIMNLGDFFFNIKPLARPPRQKNIIDIVNVVEV